MVWGLVTEYAILLRIMLMHLVPELSQGVILIVVTLKVIIKNHENEALCG